MLIERARAMIPELAAMRARHDTAKCLDSQVVERLQREGFFGALVPRELGGHELAPVEYVAVLEALAIGDSASAWCVMTASTSTLLAAYLSQATAREIWSADRVAPVFAGVFAPMGKLDHKLVGRWSWASGCTHAQWFAVGAIRDRGHVVCIVPRSDVTIIENWDTLGLAGTGSHDIAIDCSVAPDHVTSVFDRAPWPAGAVYRVPLFGLLAAGIAGCALGIARRAIDTAGGALQATSSSHQFATFAGLRARCDAARAYLASALADAYAAAEREHITAVERGALRLAAAHVTSTCAEVARGAFHIGGGPSVRAGSVLGAALRDLETIRTHRMISDAGLPAFGRAVLGVGTPSVDL
jgi:alkylation response protein AidB-like acyl-CoA dehydrogenase